MIGKLFGPGKKKAVGPVNPVSGSKTNKPSVQTWLPFYDVDRNLIWRRDKNIVAAIRIEPINIDLLSEAELERMIGRLYSVVNSINGHWVIHTTQRAVDLDSYIANLESRKQNEENFIRKRILDSAIRTASLVASSGESIEMHFYVMKFGSVKQKKSTIEQQQLLGEAEELAQSLSKIKLQARVCDDQELRELLFNFLNPVKAAFERAPQDSSLSLPPQMRRRNHT